MQRHSSLRTTPSSRASAARRLGAFVALAALAASGCTTGTPTLGERLTDSANAQAALAERAVEGERLVERGERLIARGRKRVAKGEDEVREGRALVERGEALLREVRSDPAALGAGA